MPLENPDIQAMVTAAREQTPPEPEDEAPDTGPETKNDSTRGKSQYFRKALVKVGNKTKEQRKNFSKDPKITGWQEVAVALFETAAKGGGTGTSAFTQIRDTIGERAPIATAKEEPKKGVGMVNDLPFASGRK